MQHKEEQVYLMLVKACQHPSPECGTVLLMQLNRAFFPMKMHSQMSGWLVVTKHNPKVHMKFSTGKFDPGFPMDSLKSLGTEVLTEWCSVWFLVNLPTPSCWGSHSCSLAIRGSHVSPTKLRGSLHSRSQEGEADVYSSAHTAF